MSVFFLYDEKAATLIFFPFLFIYFLNVYFLFMGACFPQDTMSQLNNSLHPQRVFTVASPPWSWLRAHPDCLYKPWHLLDLFASLISFAKKMTELFWKRRKNLDLFHWVSQIGKWKHVRNAQGVELCSPRAGEMGHYFFGCCVGSVGVRTQPDLIL